MNLEEYKKFLESNGNKEEREAIRVIDEILKQHIDRTWAEYYKSKVKLFPRFVFNGDKERIEMDLLIILEHSKQHYNRKVGVEFKETDVNKVIAQAIIRRKYVDYMYIATRDIPFMHREVFLLSYFGIGWIIWMEDFAKMIFPARFHYPTDSIEDMVNFLIEQKLKKEVDKLKEEIDKKVNEAREKLDRWLK